MTSACGGAGSPTSRLIFGAETPLALGGGACDKTWPSGASGNRICAIAPTSKPRRRILILATRSLWPDHVGNFNALRAQTFGNANLPAPPHLASCGRELREDLSFRHGGTVVLPFDIDFQSTLFRDHPGLPPGSFPPGPGRRLHGRGWPDAWQSAPKPARQPTRPAPAGPGGRRTSFSADYSRLTDSELVAAVVSATTAIAPGHAPVRLDLSHIGKPLRAPAPPILVLPP